MADDLSAPLSRRKDRVRRALRRALIGADGFPLGRLMLVVIVLIVCGLALRVFLVRDENGGRPVAEAAINSTHNSNVVANRLSTAPAGGVTITAGPEVPAASLADGGSGPSITTVGEATPEAPRTAAPARDDDGLIADLVEQTSDGPLPRKSADGTTPFEAYARPFDPGSAAGRPKLAIVVTGLGLSESGTMGAIDALPANVSLAFAPYGKTLDRTVPAARAAGHELLLSVPLEPFDFPDNDPGPKTLLTGQPPRANLDRLFWLMARFGGYIGLTNYMGARFTASAADFTPIMEEVAVRGLGWLDDGSSNRSVASELAGKDEVPFARADTILDDTPSRAAIADALAGLEEKARRDGQAIGVISALPVSVEAIASWAQGLDSRNLALVPVSALMK